MDETILRQMMADAKLCNARIQLEFFREAM